MKTKLIDVQLPQGADFNLIIQVSNSSGPQDLTGYTFSSDIKTSTDPSVEKIASFTFVPMDQTAHKGQVGWTLANSVTKEISASIVQATVDGNITVTPYLYDVLMTDNLGKITRIIQGKVLVMPGVTGEGS